MTRKQALDQIRTHRAAVRWWLEVRERFPAGVVPIATASRVLSVSPRRIRSLIEEGRIRVIEGMPGGTDRDRFVPLVDLVDAPFTLNRGRPDQWGRERQSSPDNSPRNPRK